MVRGIGLGRGEYSAEEISKPNETSKASLAWTILPKRHPKQFSLDNLQDKPMASAKHVPKDAVAVRCFVSQVRRMAIGLV